LHSQIAAKQLEVKTTMLPLIEKFIIRANGDRDAWFGLRPDSIDALRDPATKLKSLLTGRKRKSLIQAWERFSRITPDDFHIPQPGEQGEQTEKMRQLFLGRLDALREIIEDC
jgi:hypothetical protein